MLLEQNPGCTWLLRSDRVFQAVYGDAPRVFGRAAVELEETRFTDLFEPLARPSWIKRVERALRGQTLCAAGRFGEGQPTYSITLYPVAVPGGGGRFAGGTAHQMAGRDVVLRMLRSAEADRARFSGLLHDHVGQYLTAAGLQLDLLRMDLAERAFPAVARTAEIQATLDTVMQLVRNFHRELNHEVAERVGLRPALDRLVGRLRADFKGNVRLMAHAAAQPPPEAAGAFYRIAQEAAGMAAHHAGCSTIEIFLKSVRSGIVLEIRDDGKVFEAAEKDLNEQSLGLLVMQYYADRAGIELEIHGAPGSGTVVRALLPFRR